VGVLVLSGRGVVEAVVTATGEAALAAFMFVPVGEGGGGNDLGENGFDGFLSFGAGDVDIDGEPLGCGEVKEESGAAFEGEVEICGGERVEQSEGEDGLFEDKGIGSGEGFALGVDPLGAVALWGDHERGDWMPPRWRRWAESIFRRSA